MDHKRKNTDNARKVGFSESTGRNETKSGHRLLQCLQAVDLWYRGLVHRAS